MKVSVLILTHNRSNLFKRCLKSVLYNMPMDAQVLVNNDSCDIEEIPGAEYYYEKHEDLSDTYKFLFDKAEGEFIYFLEDDDYVLSTFWNMIEGIDENTIFRYIPQNDFKKYKEYFKSDDLFEEHFQLGQMFFRKSDVSEFPVGNNLHNDFELYKQINEKNKFNKSKKTIFVQTTDGKDNISFKEFNKDRRFSDV